MVAACEKGSDAMNSFEASFSVSQKRFSRSVLDVLVDVRDVDLTFLIPIELLPNYFVQVRLSCPSFDAISEPPEH